MSRCKACNKIMQRQDWGKQNPYTGEEEEMCQSCIKGNGSVFGDSVADGDARYWVDKADLVDFGDTDEKY